VGAPGRPNSPEELVGGPGGPNSRNVIGSSNGSSRRLLSGIVSAPSNNNGQNDIQTENVSDSQQHGSPSPSRRGYDCVVS
jgi:hypothetical protein